MDNYDANFANTFSVNVDDDNQPTIASNDIYQPNVETSSNSSWTTVPSSYDQPDFNEEQLSKMLSNLHVRFSLPNEKHLQRPNSSLGFSDNAIPKARPVPKHILDGSIREKMQREEEFRKIRIKIRAEEMLRSSVSPIPQRTNKIKRSNSACDISTRVPTANQIPDFRTLHFRLAKDLGKNGLKASSTVCRPFNLSTTQRRFDDDNVKLVKECVKTSAVKRTTSPVPARMTTASQLRDLSNRKKRENSGKVKDESKGSPLLKKKRIIFDFQNVTKEMFKQKAKELRKIHLERTKDYQNDLKEMKKRVQNQPLLVERQALENAKLKVEKQFKVKLKQCGVNESMINKHSNDAKNVSGRSSYVSSISNASSVSDLQFDDGSV